MGTSFARCLLFLEVGGMLMAEIASCARSSWGSVILLLWREFPGPLLFTGPNSACWMEWILSYNNLHSVLRDSSWALIRNTSAFLPFISSAQCPSLWVSSCMQTRSREPFCRRVALMVLGTLFWALCALVFCLQHGKKNIGCAPPLGTKGSDWVPGIWDLKSSSLPSLFLGKLRRVEMRKTDRHPSPQLCRDIIENMIFSVYAHFEIL